MSQASNELATADWSPSRADELFEQQRHEAFSNTDRLFGRLMALQWLVAIVLALCISPVTWNGDSNEIHPHVWAAIFFGGAISIFPIWLTHAWRGHAITRYVVSVAQIEVFAICRQAGNALLREAPDEGRTDHPLVAGNVDFLSVEREAHHMPDGGAFCP